LGVFDVNFQITGQDFAPPAAVGGAKGKEKKKQAPVILQPKEEVSSTGLKKQTRLGLEAKKAENLSEWYSQVGFTAVTHLVSHHEFVIKN